MTPHLCPFCLVPPTVEPDPWGRSWSAYCCADGDGELGGGMTITGIQGGGKTREEAIEDWNQQVEDGVCR